MKRSVPKQPSSAQQPAKNALRYSVASESMDPETDAEVRDTSVAKGPQIDRWENEGGEIPSKVD